MRILPRVCETRILLVAEPRNQNPGTEPRKLGTEPRNVGTLETSCNPRNLVELRNLVEPRNHLIRFPSQPGGLLPFEGVYSVLPTPFRGGGEIDVESLKRVVDLIVAAGVNGVTALGVTGEAARLSERERAVVVDTVVKQAAGRVKVIVGTSADGVRTCIDFSREARSLGATAVMVSPPRMPKLNSESVVNHYKALAEAVDLPIVVQDYPPISGFAMEAGLLARIAREVPAARAIKLEDPPTPFKTSRILTAAGETKV
ncbi:MAG TPA: dihydrodipicolinate synthase family protein, partial [Vicinamibacterales bacterium]